MLFLQWKEGQSVPSGIFMGYLHHNNGMYSMKVSFFFRKTTKKKKTTFHIIKISRIKGLLCTKHNDFANVLWMISLIWKHSINFSNMYIRLGQGGINFGILAYGRAGSEDRERKWEERAKNGVFSTVWCSSSLRDIQSINNHQTFCSEENEHFFPETIKTFISSDMRFTFCEQVFLQKKH